ncbi:hypothetical protein [Zunongwangia atlantica]|uniref:Uncharacterized protein n=1 Tax=Zunongwangia atlantica 22II14-10F7 TaxID=1185767 RepID=A0A1Y1T5S3_9FLAO|nr:hypothetical protein [Zunongwangia atlantica]ORL45783.1 hypothetical protein IIF7_09030 [Zunongwangia atlantica 22II14-10F7]
MNNYFYVFAFIVLMLQSCVTPKITKSYLDENGNTISRNKFYNEWHHNASKGRWDTKKGDTIEAKLFYKPNIETFKGDYQLLSVILEELSNKRYPRNTTFLISYYYKDDLCNLELHSNNNNWKKHRVRELKKHLAPQKTVIEKKYKDVETLVITQEGINFESIKKLDYLYSDTNNRIFKNLFRQSNLCGSYAIIKPNGLILVYNGESRLDITAKYLEPDVWYKYFK